MKRRYLSIALIILLFNSSTANANDLDVIIADLNHSISSLGRATKGSKQTGNNLTNIVQIISIAKEDTDSSCSDSLGSAFDQLSSIVSNIDSRTCKPNKRISKTLKCIPSSATSSAKPILEASLDSLESILNTDDNLNEVSDICESGNIESSPTPTTEATPTSTPTSTPSSTPLNQEVGSCSSNQNIPSIEDLPLNVKADFTDNLGAVEIYRYSDNDGAVFKVKNTTLTPIEVMVELKSGSENVTATIPNPIAINASSSITGFKICPTTNAAWSYNGYTFTSKLGHSSSMHTGDGTYLLPYRSGESYEVIQGETGTFSHFGDDLYSLDFGMPEGTSIRAMRDGTVISIKEDSNEGGPNKETYAKKANYVWVIHSDNSFAYYLHLKQNGALVEKGAKIKAGDIIGLSGNTGFSTGPHLHIQVTVPKGFSGTENIPIRFKGINGALEEGSSYAAN